MEGEKTYSLRSNKVAAQAEEETQSNDSSDAEHTPRNSIVKANVEHAKVSDKVEDEEICKSNEYSFSFGHAVIKELSRQEELVEGKKHNEEVLDQLKNSNQPDYSNTVFDLGVPKQLCIDQSLGLLHDEENRLPELEVNNHLQNFRGVQPIASRNNLRERAEYAQMHENLLGHDRRNEDHRSLRQIILQDGIVLALAINSLLAVLHLRLMLVGMSFEMEVFLLSTFLFMIWIIIVFFLF